MADTPVSLLERLRLRPDPAAWQRLIDLYTPLIQNWLRRPGLQASDADDLVSGCACGRGSRAAELPARPAPAGLFAAGCERSPSIAFARTGASCEAGPSRPATVIFDRMLSQLEDPESQLSREWDRQHDQHVARRLLELLAGDFERATWEAFRLLVLEGRDTAQVAAQLGISPNAVRIAKSRVLARFRQEAAGLIDE